MGSGGTRGKGHSLEHLEVLGGNFFPQNSRVQQDELIPEATAASRVARGPRGATAQHQHPVQPVVPGGVLGVELIFEAVPGS